METILLLAFQLAGPVAIGLAITCYLRAVTLRLLTDVCGTRDRAEFWVRVSAVLTVCMPLAGSSGCDESRQMPLRRSGLRRTRGPANVPLHAARFTAFGRCRGLHDRALPSPAAGVHEATRGSDRASDRAIDRGGSMNILVCGAHGFIGAALCDRLERGGHRVVKGVRHATAEDERAIDYAGALGPDAWDALLQGIDVVINAVGILIERVGRPSTASTPEHRSPCSMLASGKVSSA